MRHGATTPDRKGVSSILLDLRHFTMLSGVGHWPQLEAKETTSEALLEFIRNL